MAKYPHVRYEEQIGLMLGCIAARNLHWLPLSGVIPLTEEACLVGHDGWGDGRYGDYWESRIELNDWEFIEEFQPLRKKSRLEKLRAMGDEPPSHFRSVLPDALARFQDVVVL